MKKLSSDIDIQNLSNFNLRLVPFLSKLKRNLPDEKYEKKISSSLLKLTQYQSELKSADGDKRETIKKAIIFHIALIAGAIRQINEMIPNSASSQKNKLKLCDFCEEILQMGGADKSTLNLYVRLPYDRVFIYLEAKSFSDKQVPIYLQQILSLEILDYASLRQQYLLGSHIFSFVMEILRIGTPAHLVMFKNFYESYLVKLIYIVGKFCENPQENSVERYSSIVNNMLPLIELYIKVGAHQNLKTILKMIGGLWIKHVSEHSIPPETKRAIEIKISNIMKEYSMFFQTETEILDLLNPIYHQCQSQPKEDQVPAEDILQKYSAVREVNAIKNIHQAWQRCMDWKYDPVSKDQEGWMYACLQVATKLLDHEDSTVKLKQLMEKCQAIYHADPDTFEVAIIREIEITLQSIVLDSPADSKTMPRVILEGRLKSQIETINKDALLLLGRQQPDLKNSFLSFKREGFSLGLERLSIEGSLGVKEIDTHTIAINDYLIELLKQFHSISLNTEGILDLQKRILETISFLCKLISADNPQLLFYIPLLSSYQDFHQFLELLTNDDGEESALLELQNKIFAKSWGRFDEFEILVYISNDICMACRSLFATSPKNIQVLLKIITRFVEKVINEFSQFKAALLGESKMATLCIWAALHLKIVICAYLDQYRISDKQINSLLDNANALVFRLEKICEFLEPLIRSEQQLTKILKIIYDIYFHQMSIVPQDKSKFFHKLLFCANVFIKVEPTETRTDLSLLIHAIRVLQKDAGPVPGKNDNSKKIELFLQLCKRLMNKQTKRDAFLELKSSQSKILDPSKPLEVAKALLQNIFKTDKPVEADFVKFIEVTNTLRGLISAEEKASQSDVLADAILSVQVKMAERFPKSVTVICLLIKNAFEVYKKKKTDDSLLKMSELLGTAISKATSLSVLVGEKIQFGKQILGLINDIYPYFSGIAEKNKVILEFNASLLEKMFSLMNALPINDNFPDYYHQILTWINAITDSYLLLFAAERAPNYLNKLDSLLTIAQQLVEKLSGDRQYDLSAKTLLLEFTAKLAGLYVDLLIPFDPSHTVRAEKSIAILKKSLTVLGDFEVDHNPNFEKIQTGVQKIQQAYTPPPREEKSEQKHTLPPRVIEPCRDLTTVPAQTPCKKLLRSKKPKNPKKPVDVAPVEPAPAPELGQLELYQQQVSQLQAQVSKLELEMKSQLEAAQIAMNKNAQRSSKKSERLEAAKLKIQELTAERDQCVIKRDEFKASIDSLKAQLHEQNLEITARDARVQRLEGQKDVLIESQRASLQLIQDQERQIQSLRLQLQQQEEKQKTADAKAATEKEAYIQAAVQAALAIQEKQFLQRLEKQYQDGQADVVSALRKFEAIFRQDLSAIDPAAALKWKPNFSFASNPGSSSPSQTFTPASGPKYRVGD